MVYTCRADTSRPSDLNGIQEQFIRSSTRHFPSHRGSIAPNIKDTAAAHLTIEKTALRVEIRPETERGSDNTNLPDRPALYEFNHLRYLWVAPIHERLHEEHIIFARRGYHCGSLRTVHTYRLLDEQMLPRFRALYRPLCMQRVDGCNINRIHGLVCEESFVIVVSARNTEIACQSFQTGVCPTRDRKNPPGVRKPHPVAENIRNTACTHNAPVQHL